MFLEILDCTVLSPSINETWLFWLKSDLFETSLEAFLTGEFNPEVLVVTVKGIYSWIHSKFILLGNDFSSLSIDSDSFMQIKDDYFLN